MKTAMQEWIEWLNAYSYELPLELQIKANELIELEKQNIIDAVNEHDKQCVINANYVICQLKTGCKMLFEYDGKAGEQYYNEILKDKL